MSSKINCPRNKRRTVSESRNNNTTTPAASTGSDLSSISVNRLDTNLEEQDDLTSPSASLSTWDTDSISEQDSVEVSLLAPSSIRDDFGGRSFYEQCFVERFVELSTSRREGTGPDRPKSWIFTLPKMLSEAQNPSMRYPILAASLIYFAVVQRNKSAELEAVRWYLAGLESHRSAIQRSTNSRELLPSAFDQQNICVPMLFLYFETMRGTTSMAWAHHIAAAVNGLEGRSPRDYREGDGHVIFRSLRSYAAFKSVLQNDPSNLASDDWCHTPFTDNPKIPYDDLVDILLSIPHHLKLYSLPGGDLRESISRIPQLGQSDQTALEKETLVILQKLQNWWWHFRQDIGVVVQPVKDLATDSFADSFAIPANVTCMYPDTLTAKSVSMYNAINIILHSILISLEEGRPSPSGMQSGAQRYRSVIQCHSSSVLTVAEYQNWRHPYCGDTMRTAFALKIVSSLGVDPEREKAQSIIEGWGLEGVDRHVGIWCG